MRLGLGLRLGLRISRRAKCVRLTCSTAACSAFLTAPGVAPPPSRSACSPATLASQAATSGCLFSRSLSW